MLSIQVQSFLILLITLVGAYFDIKFRKVPNWLTFGAFFSALTLNLCSLKLSQVLNCVLGLVVGILLLLIPYMMGGMGAGDVKLLGAIGSFVGYQKIISIFINSAIAGFVLGLLWILLRPGHLKFLITTGQILPATDKKEKIPYAIAIFFGTVIYITLGKKGLINLI